MNMVRALALTLVVLGATIGLVFLALFAPENTTIVRAYGVVSPCGVHAVIVVRADGTSELYDASRMPTSDVEHEVLALPEADRAGVVVPCEQPSLGFGA